MDNRPVILFDGVCNLCRSSVQFVLRREREEVFLFASQQSEEGQSLLSRYAAAELSHLNTIILIEDGRAYYKSTAFLKILKYLRFPWPLFYGFILLPRKMRDFGYDFIGQRRYKWFGKMESCWVPDKDVSHRFLDQK